MFVIQFIYLIKHKQQTKEMGTHFFVSFRLIHSFKRRIFTKRLNDGFRLNAHIPNMNAVAIILLHSLSFGRVLSHLRDVVRMVGQLQAIC